MTNLFPNNLTHCKGAAMLVTSVILIVLSTLIIIFAANNSRMLNMISGNQSRGDQAYIAAEAGLEFGLSYLQQHSATILANPSNGFITNFGNSSTQNVVLANSSRYTITYTNPTQNNYQTILITSTGTSADGSTTRVMSQKVGFVPILSTTPTNVITDLGSVQANGSVSIRNTETNKTIEASESITLIGSSRTVTNTGNSSSAGNLKNDISQNNAALAAMNGANFFSNFFGTTSTSSIQNRMANTFSNSSSTNYSAMLNGMSGTSIWINQPSGIASITGNTTIGSAANPVLLIVNGRFSVSGNVTIYGMIYIIGESDINTTFSGTVDIIGAVAAQEDLTLSGNVDMTYNSSVLNNLRNQSAAGRWAKLAGTWKDY